MLLVAIAAHLWGVHAPQTPPSSLPILVPEISDAGGRHTATPIGTVANAPEPAVSSASASSSASGISLRVDVVHALPSSTLERTRPGAMQAGAESVPVATTGIVAASDVTPVDDQPVPELIPIPMKLPEVSEPVISADVLTRVAPRSETKLAYLSRPTPPVPPVELPDPKADLRKQEQVVLQILNAYARAYDRMDVQAAKAVWPSLDDRALQRAFQQLEGQQVQLGSCGVSISGSNANARCRGNATYRPKVGPRVLHLTQREWTFNLSRGESGWQIVNTTVQ